MAWVIDKDKERARDRLISDLTGHIAAVTARSKEVQDLITRISLVAGGTPSGTDARWSDSCRRVLNNLSETSGQLRQALQNARRLDIMKWVEG